MISDYTKYLSKYFKFNLYVYLLIEKNFSIKLMNIIQTIIYLHKLESLMKIKKN